MYSGEPMINVFLVGNPNAGKSTVFNRLTGAHAHVGNWHGVTVSPFVREVVKEGIRLRICDLPGMYSLEGGSMEEKSAFSFLESQDDGVVVFVAECTTFPRAYPLLLQMATRYRCMLVLTKYKRFLRAGGYVNIEALKKRLKIPVFIADEHLERNVIHSIPYANKIHETTSNLSVLEYRSEKRGLSKIDQFFSNSIFACCFFVVFILLAFWMTFSERALGGILKTQIEDVFFERLYAWTQLISSPVLRSFLGDGLVKSVGSVLSFLPQILMLFFFLTILEESGLISRLAMLSDGILSKIGLSGRAVFSLLMGFGCTASAILTTRGLDDKRTQRKVISCLPYLSCSAKLPVYLTVSASFFRNPAIAALLLYGLGIAIAMLVLLISKTKATPLILEIAPLQIPRPFFVAKSLLFQAKQFIIKLATVILAFFMLSWLLSSFNFSFELCDAEQSMLAAICKGLEFLFFPIGCGDWRITYAAISGLVAKENVAGVILMFFSGFPYSAQSAFAFSVFILTCSPCVSAIAASAREIGVGKSIVFAILQTGSALLFSYAVYYILMGGIWLFGLGIAVILAYYLYRKDHFERIYRKRNDNVKKF